MTSASDTPANPFAWATPGPADLDLFEKHLRDFVPTDAFDAHAHLWRIADLGAPPSPMLAAGPPEVTRAVYDQHVSGWMPARCPKGGLFFPFPSRTLDVEAANQFLAEQLEDDPHSRGLMMITPKQDPAEVERQIVRHRFAGFKVYHLFAERADTFFAASGEFIPEWAWEIANRHRLVIMLHMVLPRALAEEANQKYIRQHCEAYPGARLILAHAARGFCGRHTTEGIGALRGLDNVFFDTSAVCEASGFEAILKTFGPTRLFFGTDFAVSEMRTRCVNLGDGYLWLNEARTDFSHSRFAQPTLLGIESLLALKEACENMHLTAGDVEEIFCLGARRLLDLPLPRPPVDVQSAYRQAKELIPGGTQLLSKRPEMFAPDQWPAYYSEARGCEVIDIEGRRFTDMSTSGILSCLCGYADPEVNAAVIRRVNHGSMATLQTHDEVDLAKLMVEIHPWARMARFTRSGGEAMTVAIRIARARTERIKIAICGYHGWHDWYLAANLPSPEVRDGSDPLNGHLLPGLEPKGVPAALAGSALMFRYNCLDELDAIIAKHGRELAAIVMEPTRHTDPAPGFLEGVRERCDRTGARLIFDEISIGWRLCLGGAHRKFGVTPDISVFAKAMSNGYAMGAIIGTADIMQAAQESFISSTYWTEGVGPAAALATVRKLKRHDAPAHLARIGRAVEDGWRELGRRHGVPVTTPGRSELALIGFDHPEAAALTTLMTARMLKRGFLAGAGFVATLAHQDRHVDAYLSALDDVFAEMAQAILEGNITQKIGGPVKHSAFARLT